MPGKRTRSIVSKRKAAAESGNDAAGKAKLQPPFGVPDAAGDQHGAGGGHELNDRKAGEIGQHRRLLGADDALPVSPAVKQAGDTEDRDDHRSRRRGSRHQDRADQHDRSRDDEFGERQDHALELQRAAEQRRRDEEQDRREPRGEKGSRNSDAEDEGEVIHA